MAINLTNFTENVNNIQALADRPNDTDGLTSGELKARFDKAGSDIKEYLNGTHIPELEQALNSLTNKTTGIDSKLSTAGGTMTGDLSVGATITANNYIGQVNGLADDHNTFNGTDTMIPVIANNKIQHVKIGKGTSLPTDSSWGDGSIFFLY